MAFSAVALGAGTVVPDAVDAAAALLLGQIAVANFVNPAGLEAVGDSLYKETQASGAFDGIGTEIISLIIGLGVGGFAGYKIGIKQTGKQITSLFFYHMHILQKES